MVVVSLSKVLTKFLLLLLLLHYPLSTILFHCFFCCCCRCCCRCCCCCCCCCCFFSVAYSSVSPVAHKKSTRNKKGGGGTEDKRYTSIRGNTPKIKRKVQIYVCYPDFQIERKSARSRRSRACEKKKNEANQFSSSLL